MGFPSTVIFDLDGTLVDHEGALAEAMQVVISTQPELSGMSLERALEIWTWDFTEMWKLVVSGQMTLEENRAMRFRNIFASLGKNLDPEKAKDIVNLYGERYSSSMKRIPGAWELIEELRKNGISIGILTNHSLDYQRRKLRSAGYPDFYDFFVTPDQTGAMKPERKIFETALYFCNTPPESVVMVGDTFGEDIIGARNAGIFPVWFNRFRRSAPPVDFPYGYLESYIPLGDALSIISRQALR